MIHFGESWLIVAKKVPRNASAKNPPQIAAKAIKAQLIRDKLGLLIEQGVWAEVGEVQVVGTTRNRALPFIVRV